jgi:hypothetical protein
MGRRLLVFAATVASLVALTSRSAAAVVPTGTLTSTRTATRWQNLLVSRGISVGQTFKAGMSGPLARVSIEVALGAVADVARPAVSGSVKS